MKELIGQSNEKIVTCVYGYQIREGEWKISLPWIGVRTRRKLCSI